jgi:hypothetical protein
MDSNMVNMSEILHSFDRKERAWLVRNAMGCMAPRLDPKFLETVSDKLKLKPKLPPETWWGIDFHLDWLAAVLHAFHFSAFSNEIIMRPEMNDKDLLTHTIEDIDLIMLTPIA